LQRSILSWWKLEELRISLQPILSNNKDLGFSRYHSNLKLDYSSGVSSLTVYSISQFAINQVLLIGEWGNEGTEIVLSHSVTAPSGETVSLASPLVKSHAKDTPIYIISFNQIEFSHADTLTGSKTLLGSSPYTIDPEQDEMLYEDATNTSGYYFTRYKNSLTGNYSDYSDGIPYSGLPTNTVGYAIDSAMNELHQPFTESLTFPMVIGFCKDMLALVRGKLVSWNKYKQYEQNFGTVTMGARSYTLPTDVYDKDSNASIKSLRIGDNLPMYAINRDEYIEKIEDATYTEVVTQALAADTSLVLSDTSDLDDDGSLYVYKSGVRYTIEYTANDRTTNTLTVATDQITVTLPVGSQVWQGVEEGEPEYFSVWGGELYIWPLPSDIDSGKNITGDYLTDIETIDSQMDVISGNYFNMLKPYLRFRIRGITENNGMEDLKDPSYTQFRELLQDCIKNEPLMTNTRFRPRDRSASYRRDNDLDR
jgi:hypothetical protein